MFSKKKKKKALRCNHFKTNKYILLICVYLTILDVNHHWNRYPATRPQRAPRPQDGQRSKCACQGNTSAASLLQHLLLIPGTSNTGKRRQHPGTAHRMFKMKFLLENTACSIELGRVGIKEVSFNIRIAKVFFKIGLYADIFFLSFFLLLLIFNIRICREHLCSSSIIQYTSSIQPALHIDRAEFHCFVPVHWSKSAFRPTL